VWLIAAHCWHCCVCGGTQAKPSVVLSFGRRQNEVSILLDTAAEDPAAEDVAAEESREDRFQVMPGLDIKGHDLESSESSDMEGCIWSCKNNKRCAAVVIARYEHRWGCYFKSAAGPLVKSDGTWLATSREWQLGSWDVERVGDGDRRTGPGISGINCSALGWHTAGETGAGNVQDFTQERHGGKVMHSFDALMASMTFKCDVKCKDTDAVWWDQLEQRCVCESTGSIQLTRWSGKRDAALWVGTRARKKKTKKKKATWLPKLVIVIPTALRLSDNKRVSFLPEVLQSLMPCLHDQERFEQPEILVVNTDHMQGAEVEEETKFCVEKYSGCSVLHLQNTSTYSTAPFPHPFAPASEARTFLSAGVRHQTRDLISMLEYVRQNRPGSDVMVWEDDQVPCCPGVCSHLSKSLREVYYIAPNFVLMQVGYGLSGALISHKHLFNLTNHMRRIERSTPPDLAACLYVTASGAPVFYSVHALSRHVGVHSALGHGHSSGLGCRVKLNVNYFCLPTGSELPVLGTVSNLVLGPAWLGRADGDQLAEQSYQNYLSQKIELRAIGDIDEAHLPKWQRIFDCVKVNESFDCVTVNSTSPSTLLVHSNASFDPCSGSLDSDTWSELRQSESESHHCGSWNIEVVVSKTIV